MKRAKKAEKEALKPAKPEQDDEEMSDVSSVMSMDDIKPQIIVKEDPFPTLHAAHTDLNFSDSANEAVQSLYIRAMKEAGDKESLLLVVELV